MSADPSLVFYHSPQTRSMGVRILLEELGAPHTLRVLNMKRGEQRQPDYLAINPMGKVPAIVHDGALVTEQAAIFIYLGDLFPQAGLAPTIGDPLRGPYLRWLAFYAACLEPAVVDRAMKREPGAAAMTPYGDYDSTMATLIAQLAKGPYVLGDRFSAADILWGTAMNWMLGWKLVPAAPEIVAYAARIAERPAYIKVGEADAALAAEHQKAAEANV
jgi:glutathione S-transferase